MNRSGLVSPSMALRCLGALGFAAAAVTLRWALLPVVGRPLTMVLIFPAIVASTRLLGIVPGLVTVAACGVEILEINGDRDFFRLGIYLFLAALAIFVTGAWVRARALAAENAAQREREEHFSAQLRAIVESSEDAVISKDLSGRIQSWNRAAEKIYGYTAAEAMGRPLAMLLPPDRSGEEGEIVARIRRGDPVRQFETERIRKDGKIIQVALTVSPIHGPSGELTGISHIVRDISERKALEEQMRQTQKLESLGVLVGGLAHDFNNLLTGIMGNASMVRHTVQEDPVANRRLDEIIQASERAAQLIRQMLAYAGKGRFLIERLNIAQLVDESLPVLQSSVPQNVKIQLKLDHDIPSIEADRAQIQQLITNLALNAAEAIEREDGVILIGTSSRPSLTGSEVLLEVEDNGCGISQEDRERIFDPFFTTKFTGRGLGLAAVLGIIRAHGGSIAVDSAPGRGSKFTVALPAATAAQLSAP